MFRSARILDDQDDGRNPAGAGTRTAFETAVSMDFRTPASAGHGEIGRVVADLGRDTAGQAVADVDGRPRTAKPVSLHHVDAGGAQEEVLLGGLDAFGRDLHAE